MNFLRNCWYMAAWGEKIAAGESLARTLVGLPLLFHRRAHDGRVLAVDDRCPHRFAPLSRGIVISSGVVRCGYHGLEFDLKNGRCVRNPHGRQMIPPAMQVGTYPVVERDGIVWFWPGDQPADESLIPDYSVFHTSAEPVSRLDHMLMDAPFHLIVDNLLDLSHVNYLHDGILGNEAMSATSTTVEQEGESLMVKRYMREVPPPGVHDRLFLSDGAPVDHWLNIRWNIPSSVLLDTGITVPGGTRDAGTGYFGAHILTPETETTCHYHTCTVRWNVTAGSEIESVQRELADLRLFAFQEQDEPMIRAQHLSIQKVPAGVRQIAIETDIGVVRWRRVMQGRLDREAETRQSLRSPVGEGAGR